MINGLIDRLWKKSRDAAILILGIYVFVWAFKQINPAYLLEKSEEKQIAYVDKAVARIEVRLERMEDKIDRIPRTPIPGIATLPIDVNNNKN